MLHANGSKNRAQVLLLLKVLMARFLRGPLSENGGLRRKVGICPKRATMIDSPRNQTLICFISKYITYYILMGTWGPFK